MTGGVYAAILRNNPPAEETAMGESLLRLFALHPKAIGIIGDSLTFVGSVLLSLEALFKQTERLSVDTKKTIVKFFPSAEELEGDAVDPELVEKKWLKLWGWASKAGTILLAAGFAFLLLGRIFAE